MRRRDFVLFLLVATGSCAQPARLEVKDAWTRGAIGDSATAAVFMTITSPAPDRLIAASTPVATRTDLMTMAGDGSAMAMSYVDAIDIPANTPFSLDPSGLHVWLAGLNHPLRAGESFPLVLEFDKAGERRVIVSVIAPTAAPPMSGM